MRVNAQRLGLLFVSFFLIGTALVACSVSQGQAPAPPVGPNGNVFTTPNPNLNSPTPTFPVFTVGTWPSNYSPGNNDTITIYVLCRIQDPTMKSPAKAAAGIVVTVDFSRADTGAPTMAPQTGETGEDGIAAFTVQLNDPNSGIPIIVGASATYNGVPYVARTFFTPNPAATPSPSASATAATATP